MAQDKYINPEEKTRYEASLKYYRDLKNVVDTSYEEGREEGRAEKETEMILRSHDAGVSLETLSQITGKSIGEVERIIREAGQ